MEDGSVLRYSGREFLEKLQSAETKWARNLEDVLIQYYSPSRGTFYTGKISGYKVDKYRKFVTFFLLPCMHTEKEVEAKSVFGPFSELLNSGAIWEINPACGHVFPTSREEEYIKIYGTK